MFGLMFWRSSFLLFETLDRSVLEQVDLLSARPPDMLPFMIKSRMDRQPAVLTQVGLFGANGELEVGDIPALPAGLVPDGLIHQVQAPSGSGQSWRAAARHLPDGRILAAARSADEILEVRTDLIHGAAIGIVPAILLSLAGGAIVGIATERRLRRINAVAERVIAGELEARLPGGDDGDELDRLCAVVNRVLQRNQDTVAALGNVGDNIAHDLRTPLTALRSRLERMHREAGHDTQAAESAVVAIGLVDRSLAIVRALLRIADIRHVRRTSDFRPVDLASVVREVAEAFEPVADEKGVTLTTVQRGEATVVGDRQLLVEAVVNLVDNGIKFTQAGGLVTVTLTGEPPGPVIEVSDNGCGIPSEARDRVFQRFYRGEASRSADGSGLGLSMVMEIATLHGFVVTLDDAAPGCRFRLHCYRGVVPRR